MRWARGCGTLAVLFALAGAAVAGFSATGPRVTAAVAAKKPARSTSRAAARRIVPAHAPALLPEGPGQGIAQRGCLICHSAMLITQQHKDSTGWEKTVSLMEKWGAPVSPAERETLMTYLRARFGASVPPPAK